MNDSFTIDTCYGSISSSRARPVTPTEKQRKDISILIDKYSQAREKRDTHLLKDILTKDIDQLVSTGEGGNGIDASVKGMLNGSSASPDPPALLSRVRSGLLKYSFTKIKSSSAISSLNVGLVLSNEKQKIGCQNGQFSW